MPAGLPTSALYAQHPTYVATLWALVGAGAAAAAVLLWITAPYGRHVREGWGPVLPARWGWVLMEAPALIGFLLVAAQTPGLSRPVPALLASLYLAHYAYRAFVYPLRLRGAEHRTQPLLTVLLAVAFNLGNGSANATALAVLSPHLDAGWWVDPRLGLGLTLFALGQGLNHHADAVLRGLRAPGETGYRVPHGGGWRWVSAPNYLGELIAWTGWAIACWTAAAWVFVWFTACNLVPRAIANHRWYRERFPDYPPERRALIPFLL